MDVKFPFDNYMRFLETEVEGDRERSRLAFLHDVKGRITEVCSRDYINQDTVDYVLLFIPNEQIYAFIHEQDHLLLDTAIKSKVVLCSPTTLFAILAVIHQAVETFALEQTSKEILSLLSAFNKQWEEFVKKMEGMGKKLADAQKEYDSLLTTRRHALERPLRKIDELRKQHKLPIGLEDGGAGTLEMALAEQELDS